MNDYDIVRDWCVCLLSRFGVVQQAPLSMGFSRWEYWRGLLCRSGDLVSLALAGGFFTTSATWEALSNSEQSHCGVPWSLTWKNYRETRQMELIIPFHFSSSAELLFPIPKIFFLLWFFSFLHTSVFWMANISLYWQSLENLSQINVIPYCV